MIRLRIFQSTPSVWKATRGFQHVGKWQFDISIHAFRVEGDWSYRIVYCNCRGFQSTPSVWKATLPMLSNKPYRTISIHAFRVEGDSLITFQPDFSSGFQSTPSVWKATISFESVKSTGSNFNPRLPCGRRLQKLTGDLLNTHIICIYVHKAVALFYNQWHRKPLSTLLFYNFFGANGTVILCLHPIRTKTATLLQHQNRYSRRSVRLWFYSYCRDNRT